MTRRRSPSPPRRDRFLRVSIAAFAALLAAPWILGVVGPEGDSGPRSLEPETFFARAGRQVAAGLPVPDARRLALSAADTLALGLTAIAIAAVLGALFSLGASRRLASPEPYVPEPVRPSAPLRAAFFALRTAARSVLALLRALPEYLLAFLLVGCLGPSPWALAAAVGLHNLGVLGRLFSEGIDHLPEAPAAALRAIGARRRQLVAAVVAPAFAPKGTALAFYRLEMCVREASVLGVLGVPSLGFLLDEARVRGRADVFLLVSAVVALLVLSVDFLSQAMVSRLDAAPPRD